MCLSLGELFWIRILKSATLFGGKLNPKDFGGSGENMIIS
jgi:hypothetical protein